MPSTLELPAHMAPIAFKFFGSASNITAQFSGDALVAWHGSWNRSKPSGYKVQRIHFENGTAVGAQDFMTGFLKPGFLLFKRKTRFGRPAGITVTPSAFDSTRNVYYVSSARTGTVGKVTPEGVYTVLHADSMLKSTYGMKIHPDGKRLFVCVGDANYSKFTSPDTRQKMIRLISIDLNTGKRLSDMDLAGLIPGKHFGNDLVFDEKGNIYMTDSFANAIYKISPEGKASVFSKNKKFETKGIGLNGIIYHPSGFLLVDNSNTGQIFKVDIANPDNVQKVSIDQYFLGADGMLMDGNDKVTIVVNGGSDKIFQLKSEDNFKSAWLSGTTLAADRFTYPSTAAKNGKDIWIMNAKFSELTDSNSVPPKTFAIQLAKLKPVPKMKK